MKAFFIAPAVLAMALAAPPHSGQAGDCVPGAQGCPRMDQGRSSGFGGPGGIVKGSQSGNQGGQGGGQQGGQGQSGQGGGQQGGQGGNQGGQQGGQGQGQGSR